MKPKWQLALDAKWIAHLREIRARWGGTMAKPSLAQTHTIAKQWSEGRLRAMMEYCRKRGINPNEAIKSINSKVV
jgi:hypothetical protein